MTKEEWNKELEKAEKIAHQIDDAAIWAHAPLP